MLSSTLLHKDRTILGLFQVMARENKCTGEGYSHNHKVSNNMNNNRINHISSHITSNHYPINKSQYFEQPKDQFHPSIHFNFANIQTKLKVSEPGDSYEQEADRIAEHVMHMSVNSEYNVLKPLTSTPMKEEKLNRKCQACQDEEEKKNKIMNISRKSAVNNRFSYNRSNEMKIQKYVTETFQRSPGITSQQDNDIVFRSAISDSWCPCDGTCPKCKEAKNYDIIQTKSRISKPDDAYEKEADRVAEEVMRMSSSSNNVNRKCKDCEVSEEEEEEEKMKLSRKTSSSGEMNNLEISDNMVQEIDSTLHEGGSPLDLSTRDFMESRFGFDFGKVRIHTDQRAATSAEQLNAHAYTIGSDIAFAQEKYAPNTSEGRKLLAHELAHVVQNSPVFQRENLPIKYNKGDPKARPKEYSTVIDPSELVAIQQMQMLSRQGARTTVQSIPPSGRNTCGFERQEIILPVALRAIRWVEKSISLLDGFITTPNNRAVRNALIRHFHSIAPNITTIIKGRLDSIRENIESIFVAQKSHTVECPGNEDRDCSTPAGVGARVMGNRVVICPSFFQINDWLQAEYIVHEMAHTLVGGGPHITDRGYVHDRVYPFLTTAEALTNAESFGLFVQDLGTGRVTPLTAPYDSIEDCPDDWQPLIRNAIAWAQAWNYRAYRNLSVNSPRNMRNKDRYLLAYDEVRKGLQSPIGFQCEPKGGGRCEGGYATYWYVFGDLHLCPAWRNLRSQEDRILSMLIGLYGKIAGVDSDEDREGMAKFAQSMRIH